MLTIDGKLYVRVSQVIQPFSNINGIPKEILDRKASIGTIVHQYIDDFINGNVPISVVEALGYIESFHKWRDAIHPSFPLSEVRYCDEDKMFTGQLDALAKIDGESKAVLIDFKCSAQESPTWEMQAHLYHYLYKCGKLVVQEGDNWTIAKDEAPKLELADTFLWIKLDKAGGYPKVFRYKFSMLKGVKCVGLVDEFWKKLAINT